MFFKIASKDEHPRSFRIIAFIVSICVVLTGYVVGQIPLGIYVAAQLAARDGVLSPTALEDFSANVNFSSIGIDANTGLILILLSFVGALMGLWFCIAFIYKRKLISLITPLRSIRWERIWFGFSVWMFAAFLLELLSYILSPETYVFQLNWSKWIPLVMIALLILPLQTSFEELFMRGVLLQEVGLATNSRLIALVITSVLFGAMHLANPEIQKFGLWLMMPYYIGMGLFLGILTLMDDGLELALGIHAATNIFSSVFVTFDGSALQTDALFRVTSVNINFMIPVFYLLAVGFIYICARRYGWTDWSKVYGSIRNRWQESEDFSVNEHLVENIGKS